MVSQINHSIRSLHIDIEGGYGGSSRSLYELVSRLDRSIIEPHVVFRQPGPAIDWYKKINMPATVVPEIASFVPRDRAYFRNLIATAPRFRKILVAEKKISELIESHRINLIHYNYEGLFFLARRLQKRFNLPAIAHSRAIVGSNILGRFLAAELSKSIDKLFCISPNELKRWNEIVKTDVNNSEIMWNIARKAEVRKPFARIPEVVYFGNLDYSKGTDRLIDIAKHLEAIKAPPIKIVIYGSARVSQTYHRSLFQRINDANIPDRIELGGHCIDPMQRMASALALLRPSRRNDPWGRDVIEAAAAGLPAIATGSFDGVIKPGITGWLIEPFDIDEITTRLCTLLQSPEIFQDMSKAAQEHAQKFFSGSAQVARFTEIAQMLVSKQAGAGV